MHSQISTDAVPWYRQGWPWFLIALPATAVIGGIITTILAVRSADGVIAVDYYKRGLSINEELSRTARERELGLNAQPPVDAKAGARADDGRREQQYPKPAGMGTPP